MSGERVFAPGLFELFQDFQKMLFQRSQIVPVGIPHVFRAGSHIIVNQDVSHPDDVTPRNFRVFCLKRIGNLVCGFPEDREVEGRGIQQES